jgi:hypothetical protein
MTTIQTGHNKKRARIDIQPVINPISYEKPILPDNG